MNGKHPFVSLNWGDIRAVQTVPSAVADKDGDAVTSQDIENRETVQELRMGEAVEQVFPTTSSQPPQSSMTRFVNVIKRLPVQKSRTIDVQLLKMICKEYHPFSLVEDKEFVRFVELLNPSFTLPSRKTLSHSLLPAVHKELFEKVKSELIDRQAICLTSDGWTSVTNSGFYALTAHFIDKNGEMKSYLLECSEFTFKHTAENIAEWISNVLRKFEIEYKITAIVTDNATNMRATANILKIRHVRCFAHSLNLVVQNAIANSVAEVVEKCKGIVKFFKKSSHASAKLREMQVKLGQKELKLKQDVVTRWNSIFDMLERLIRSKEAIVSTLALLDSSRCALETDDWEIIRQSMEVLRPFNDVTTEISSEKTGSLSKTTVMARLLSRQLRYSDSAFSQVKKLITELGEGLKARFGERESNELISQAILLDPRFRKQGFGDDQKYRVAYQTLIQKIRQLPSASNEGPQLVEPEPQSSTTHSTLWKQFDETVSRLQGKSDPTSASIVELDKFLAEPYLHRTGDPLAWWETRKHMYPKLHRIMLRRLCIPATSVPCERIFSKTGQLVTEKRSRLKSKHIAEMIFVNANAI
ncbi:E3 SUMO-protein ligase ZBED1-like [Wyeomyia smithii]|uniref:E3 SUMO-protein ligase ZBED1-like n=1 Tax=Wyeomyia smithii TaxID=174621 RepID=UPI002467CA09|nr:E3 SUMO-protein ligase ZBED1-like [Wyeomyia smithii]